MGLSNDLMSQFAKATIDKHTETETTVYGTVVRYDDKYYVKLDGSDRLTPMPATAEALPNDRVSIKIKNHTATITGNVSSPASRIGKVEEIDGKLKVYIPILEADGATFKMVESEFIKTDRLNAIEGTFDTIKTHEADIERLSADYAEIDNLAADNAEITNLKSISAWINHLYTNAAKIDTLIFGSATGDSINTQFANSVIAAIGEAQITSAMIESISADKILAGTISTNKFTVQSEDGRLAIAGEQITIRDESGQVRVLIGDDNYDGYTICIWDADGNPMFDATGITEHAIREAIIKNDMIADDANISAGKIDMESLFSEINDGVRKINCSKLYYDDEEQTLDLVFKQMQGDADTLSDAISSQGLKLQAALDHIESKVWEQYTDSATGALDTKYSDWKQDVDGFRATVRDTYATKEDLNNIDVNLDLEIGGRNYLINTNTSKMLEHASSWSVMGDVFIFSCSTLSPSGAETESNSPYNSTLIAESSMLLYDSYIFYEGALLEWLLPDTDYVVSFDIYAEEVYDTALQIYVSNTQSNNLQTERALALNQPVAYEWTHIECPLHTVPLETFPDNTDLSDQAVCIRFGEASLVGTCKIKNLKLEKGTKATAWTPAPEDMATTNDIESIRNEFAELYVTKEGIGGIVGETYATKDEVASKIGELALTKENFEVTIGDTYTTPDTVDSKIANLALTPDNFTVTLDSKYASKDALDDLEIGGRNYLIGTSETAKQYKFYSWQVYLSNEAQDVTTFTVSPDIKPKLTVGQKVTLSAFIENTTDTNEVGLMFMVYTQDADNGIRQYIPPFTDTQSNAEGLVIAPGESGTAYVTATLDVSNVSIVAVALRHSSGEAAESTVNVRSVKLELGDKATDWTPAPEDMATASEVEDASKTATNYLNMSNKGLVIGDRTSDTLGDNVLIDSDSVQIRNGDTWYSRFSKNSIYLGRGTDSARFDLFGNSFVVQYDSDFSDGGFGVYGKTESNYQRLAFQPINEKGNLTLGFGGYAAAVINTTGDMENVGDSSTNIWGNGMYFRAADDIHIMPKYNIDTSERYTRIHSHAMLSNACHLYGIKTDGNKSSIAVLNANNDVVFGYGSKDQWVGNAYYQGHNVIINSNTDVTINANAEKTGNINLNGVTKTPKVTGTGNYSLTFGVNNNTDLMYVYQASGDTTKNKWLSPKTDGGMLLGSSTTKWGQIYSTNSAISNSDRNVKSNISQFDEHYEALFSKLQPRTFKFVNGASGRIHSGFISQDVEDALSEVGLTALDFAAFCKDIKTKEVTDPETGEITFVDVYDEDGNPEYNYSLRYEEFIALNTHMIQKLQAENQELKDKVNSLEERLAKLESLITEQ